MSVESIKKQLMWAQISGNGAKAMLLKSDLVTEKFKTKHVSTPKQNWFNTLNEALESECLTETWDSITMGGIGYGESVRYTYDNGTKHGHFITICRDERGMYERPVHYARQRSLQ